MININLQKLLRTDGIDVNSKRSDLDDGSLFKCVCQCCEETFVVRAKQYTTGIEDGFDYDVPNDTNYCLLANGPSGPYPYIHTMAGKYYIQSGDQLHSKPRLKLLTPKNP